jgi:hypothetical protein
MGSVIQTELQLNCSFFKRFDRGNLSAKALSSRKRREKEDRIGESQPFQERTLSVQDKIRPERKSNPRPSAYKTDELSTKQTRLASLLLQDTLSISMSP